MSACATCGTEIPAGASGCPNCATQAFSPERAAGFPDISGYRILSRIGEGGMGAIYLAEETSLGRRVAIKVIAGKVTADKQAQARFVREARALATVEHANVVRVYSFGDVGGQAYLAMEYVDGETLADRIRRVGRLPVEEAVRFTREILVALDAAWEKGIVHRDIKPSNVLIDRRGQIHVADFGLAKPHRLADDMILTQSGHVLGTPYYMAPEQAQGKETDFRADIYSTGILLYEMLAGERPFEGITPFDVVAKHLNEPLPAIRAKRSDVPNKVVRVLERMTAKKPEERAQSYAELIGAFDALLGITPKSIPRTETFSQLPRPATSGYRTPLIVTAVLVLAVAGWQWSRFMRPRSMAPPPESQLVIAVTPFYGPDDDSAKEGRVMAALVERSITDRLGAENVRVVGIDETKQPVRSHDAARQLGERLGAAVVVWGDAFALKRETEIQPYFTLIRRAPSQAAVATENVGSVDVRAADPVARLSQQSAPVMRVEAEAPNQIELRRTSAEGVGEMVSFLAGLHALYDESNPRKALQFFDQGPKTAETLRHRAQAYIQIGDRATAMKTLEDALALHPNHVQSRAQLADLELLAGRFKDAAADYQRVAAAAKPYTTNYGIAYRGLIYVRETFRAPGTATSELKECGTLLAVDPETEIVTRRWTMPGTIRSFEPRDDAFVIRYAADVQGKLIETLTFRGNDFEFLPPPGGSLILRINGMRPGWLLPQNFTDEFSGVITRQAAHPRFRLMKKPSPDMPQTLPELEIALREAARRDPTQPWHLFYLGQSLFAEGKEAEAEQTWNRLLTNDYPGILYWNYSFMARPAERLGQRSLADRLYERALRERQRMPQPIGFSTLIERLINAPLARLHPEQQKDLERSYLWLQRARTITGLTEADNYAATAWAAYFRRRGDLLRARVEEQNARAFALHPFNVTSIHTRVDYALYVFFAALFGFVGSTALLLVKQYRSSTETALHWRNNAVLREWLPFVLGATVASASIATRSWPAGLALFAIALIVFLQISGLLKRAAQIYHRVTYRDRVALLVMFLLSTFAAVVMNSAMNSLTGLFSMPIGIADSLGHPALIADLESRLAKTPIPELRYLTAVANQLGGKLERAQELYGQLPNDARARRALASIESGQPKLTMPMVDEMYRAYTAGPTPFVPGVPFEYPEKFVRLGIPAWFLICLALLAPLAFIRLTAETLPPEGPRSRTGRTLAKIGFVLVPGSFDLLRRSVVRGAMMMTLLGFTLLFAVSMAIAFPVMGSPGIFTAFALPNLTSSSPMPPDTYRFDLMFAPPFAIWFWSIATLSVVLLLVLHLTRIPSILALYRDEPLPGTEALSAVQEPA